MLKNRFFFFVAFIAIIMILPNVAKAQTSLSSPYSRFGIGNTSIFNNAINNSMGGVGYTMKRNNHVNYLNPASYSGVDTTSLVFDIGFYSEWMYLSTDKYKSKGNNTNLSHILIGFPISKHIKMAAGIMPMSNVQYTTSQTITDSLLGTHKTEYTGDGGLNKALIGLAYSPSNNLSIGTNIEYLFGNYYKASTISFPDSSYMYSTRKEQNYHINAFNVNFGIQYFHPLTNGDKFGFGAVYNLPMILPTDNILKHYTFTTSAGLEYIKDSIQELSSNGKIKYPQSFGLGFSYERPNRFYLALDGNYTKWSEFLFQDNFPNSNLVDDLRISLGGEYRPNPYGNYLQKIAYRAGFTYDNGMLDILDTRISQLGVSLGLGLPIKKSNTMINISLEYMKRGTIENGLIREDYLRLGISFSAKDLWFFKRKYQ